MAVHKIQASSMSMAMHKAKYLFQDDAMVLDSQKINIGGRPFFELTVSGTERKDKQKHMPQQERENQSVKENAQRILQLVNQIDEHSNTETVPASALQPIKRKYHNNHNLQELVEALFDIDISPLNHLSGEMLQLYKGLMKSGISHDVALSITETIQEQNENDVQGIVYDLIKENLTVSGDLFESIYQQRIVAMIGTAGVGKTTTLAKIASEAVLAHRKKVALFTFDIYKSGTITQLKHYANILKIPFELIQSKEAFEKKLAKYHDYDMILLDTEGINIFNDYQFHTLNHLIDIPQKIEKHLVLGSNIRVEDQERIYTRFKQLAPDYLIFSKIDETLNYGSILNMNLKTDCPISFLTNGTRVPGDLLLATKNKIAQLILSGLKQTFEGN